jgi:hypothetical protein
VNLDILSHLGSKANAASPHEIRRLRYGGSFDMMMVLEAANMPPTPWHRGHLLVENST